MDTPSLTSVLRLVPLCLVLVLFATTVHSAPLAGETEDKTWEDQTISSGDAVDPGPTVPLGGEESLPDEEAEYQVVNMVKSTPPTVKAKVIYSTMTPEYRRYTTGSTTLPPIPPTTTYPTIPPRTTMRKGEHPGHWRDTSPALSFTTAPVPEKKEDGPILGGSNDEEKSTSPVPSSTTELVPKSTTEEVEDDGAILVEVESEVTERVVLAPSSSTLSPSSTLESTTVEVQSSPTSPTDGIIVDVVAVESASKSTAETLPAKTVTLPASPSSTPLPPSSSPSPAVKSTTAEPEPEIVIISEDEDEEKVTDKVTPASSTVEEVFVHVEGEASSSTLAATVSTTPTSTAAPAEPSTSKSTIAASTTTKDDLVVVIVPDDVDDLGEENQLEKGKKDSTVSPVPSSSSSSSSPTPSPSSIPPGPVVVEEEVVVVEEGDNKMSTVGTSPVLLHSKPGKGGVLMAGLNTLPPTPEVVEDDSNVNATLIGESQQGGLSYAARTGIAMGCIVGFWIIIGPLVCLICKLRDKKRDKKEKEERDAREKANNSLVEEMVKAELQKTPNGDKKKIYNDEKFDENEIEPITIGDSDSVPYMDADANSRDTAL